MILLLLISDSTHTTHTSDPPYWCLYKDTLESYKGNESSIYLHSNMHIYIYAFTEEYIPICLRIVQPMISFDCNWLNTNQ